MVLHEVLRVCCNGSLFVLFRSFVVCFCEAWAFSCVHIILNNSCCLFFGSVDVLALWKLQCVFFLLSSISTHEI